MNTYLVAGGAGFIGACLCEELLEKGDRVICVDNLITGSKENIVPYLKHPNFIFLDQNVTEKFVVANEVSGIFHLASPASPNSKSPRSYIAFPVETLLVNSIGTYNLLELAKKKHARFVYASTSEVYGDPAVSPQPETYFGNVNPNGVRSMYDEGKRFGEAMSMTYYRKFGVNVRIMRIFNTYGPKMQKDDGRVISNFITQALTGEHITIYGDGLQTRSFCYVKDLVDGIIRLMEEQQAKGEVVNLGNPTEHTIKQIAAIVKKLTDSNSKIVYEDLPEDDPKKRKPDISKAEALLGFVPKRSLESGLEKTIEYFRSKI